MTTLYECLLRTSVAVAIVWLATLLLRRQSAALRHALWLCALASFLLIPALLPLARRTPPVPLRVQLPAAIQSVPIRLTIVAAPPSPSRPAPARPSPALTSPLTSLLLSIWLAGALVICIRRTAAAFRMTRIAAHAEPAPPSLAPPAAPAVLISDQVRTALTWGLFRPLILLPSCALDWTPDCLRSVLEHEREHIRRFDTLSHWMAELVCAAWWFNPLAWLARTRASHERECACDDAVLRTGVRPSDYASALLNLASTMPDKDKGEPIMALSALSSFERRIANLLRPGIDRRPARLAIALAAFAAILPLAVLRAQAPAGQGDLSGTVTDPSGARVAGALVTASGSTGNREITHTGAVGEWSFSGLPAGSYTVEVRAKGFAASTRTISVAAGQTATLDHALQLGAVQQSVSVVAQGQARPAAVRPSDAPQPVRIGGMVQATNLIRQVRPAYPLSAKAQGIEGTVLLQAIIAKDGSLLSVTVLNKLIDPDLAAAALRAVSQWRYQPTLLNGEPVEVVTAISIDFRLQM